MRDELLEAWWTIKHWFAPYHLTSSNTSSWDSDYMSFVIEKRRDSGFYNRGI